MKIYHQYTYTYFLLFILFVASSCTPSLNNDEKSDAKTTRIPDRNRKKALPEPDSYREAMVSFVANLADYARTTDPDFIVISQNGEELITLNGEASGPLNQRYLNAIDGLAREDLFYGYNEDNKSTPRAEQKYMLSFLERAQDEGEIILAIDYCRSRLKIEKSFLKNQSRGFISYAAQRRSLDILPTYSDTLYEVNNRDITSLQDARNFLYLINPQKYNSTEELVRDIETTNHDVLVIDLFLFDEITFTPQEMARLKTKADGGKRMVLAYMSIGEAEDYRYYWNPSWETNPPVWMEPENPNWKGNFKVKYWYPEWQSVIFGSENAYLDRILNAGFDGTYLDIIDAWYYFESTYGSQS